VRTIHLFARKKKLSKMAEVLALVKQALGSLAHGHIPPPDVIKPLLSKV
jgi:hypothetical protein